MPRTASLFAIALVYGAGIVQGVALVSFPAAGTIFTSVSGFAFSSTQYGTLFVPQVVLAIASSTLAPRLALRRGMRGVLLLGLAGDVVAMALLTASASLMHTMSAFPVLCVATGALGFGFGATVTALNTLAEGFFPGAADNAVLALNALLGLGTALSPALVAAFAALGVWWALPLSVLLLLFPILVGASRAQLNLPHAPGTRAGALAGLWPYAAAAVIYGVLETLCGNWATVYLSGERGVPAADAPFALTAFWVAVTGGRVIIAFLDWVLPARWIYIALPVLLAAALQLVARSATLTIGVVAFAAAGLTCSAILPLTISFAGKKFPERSDAISGALIAFYQIGYGIAAFGVGPLRESASVPYSTIYSDSTLVALALGIVAAVAALARSPSAHRGL